MPRASKYEIFQDALIKARQIRGVTQAEVATRLRKPQSFVSKYESGERRLDVVEFLEACKALSASPYNILRIVNSQTTLFERWGITEEELTELVDNNPSLRGIVLGYVAEKKFDDIYLEHPAITEKSKDDDHNRKKKGDRRIIYKGRTLTIEIKSLQTGLIEKIGEDEWIGKAQVDASDRRIVKLADGSELNTTLLLRGEFDLLAVNCFAFGNQWRFAFAKNSDLPFSTFKKYTQAQREALIASLITIAWPPKAPFTDNPFPLLDQLAAHPDKTLKTVQSIEAVTTDQPVIKVKSAP